MINSCRRPLQQDNLRATTSLSNVETLGQAKGLNLQSTPTELYCTSFFSRNPIDVTPCTLNDNDLIVTVLLILLSQISGCNTASE